MSSFLNQPLPCLPTHFDPTFAWTTFEDSHHFVALDSISHIIFGVPAESQPKRSRSSRLSGEFGSWFVSLQQSSTIGHGLPSPNNMNKFLENGHHQTSAGHFFKNAMADPPELTVASMPSSVVAEAAQMTPQIAELVGRMLIMDDEVLRVTPAHKALQKCAEALRTRKTRDFYHLSRKSQKISRFWSHSWHGARWQKVLTLLVLYNGLASILLGTFAALVMMLLFALGFLPGLPDVGGMLRSVWSSATGFLVSVVTFVVWKPQQQVFFDRICISQSSDMKPFAIFSLAGMLKRSDEMLVLWDPTWGDRMWCLFELAAFLKCKQLDRKDGEKERVMMVRPTFIGPCSIALFLTVCAAVLGMFLIPRPELVKNKRDHLLVGSAGFLASGAIVGFTAIMAFREYFHTVELLEQKLRNIRFNQMKSTCCQHRHVDATGNPLLCDREVIRQCVSQWFGSTSAFEESVRSEVLYLVSIELQHVFTIPWVLQICSPILWGFMDLVAASLRGGTPLSSLRWCIDGLAIWVLCAPMMLQLLVFLTHRYCGWAKWPGPCPDFCLKLSLWLVMLMTVGLLTASYTWIHLILHSRPLRLKPWIGSIVFTTALLLVLLPIFLLRRRAARSPGHEPARSSLGPGPSQISMSKSSM